MTNLLMLVYYVRGYWCHCEAIDVFVLVMSLKRQNLNIPVPITHLIESTGRRNFI